jgi:cell division protein FtsW
LIAIIGVSLLGPRDVRRLALVVYVVSLLAMIAALFVGPEIKGAHRWLIYGPLSVQPSEFVKPAFVVLAAATLAESNRTPGFPGALLTGFLYAAVAGVLILQPDFGQTMLLTVVCISLFFLAGLQWYWLALFAGAGIGGGAGAYFFVPHVASRIDRFLSAQGDTYQVDTALNAFTQGSIFGLHFRRRWRGIRIGRVYRVACAFWRDRGPGAASCGGGARSLRAACGFGTCGDVRVAGGYQHRRQS